MLILNKQQSAETIIVTLTELTTIKPAFYLLVFTQQTTKEVVSIILTPDDEESEYTERYNQFTINTAQHFGNSLTGEWHYVAYEQDNGDNTNTAGLNPVEYGKMYLKGPAQTIFKQPIITTTYKAYNGN